MSKYVDAEWLELKVHDVTLGNGAKHGCVDKLDLHLAPSVDIVKCVDCKYNPLVPRLYYDNDLINHYSWCEKFASERKFCPYGKMKGADQ